VKNLILVIAVILCFTAINKSVNAQSQDFSMTNNTGMILIDVFISPNDENNWGSDVIPKDLILDGETFNFTFTGVAADKCVWDIMFTAEDGVKYYMQNVDLCSITSITLSKD
jgi:hypothetical protein